MNIGDVMIHIAEPLSAEARSSLEDTLRRVDGVIAPRFNPSKEHLHLGRLRPGKDPSRGLVGDREGGW